MSEFQVVDPTLDEDDAKEIRKEIKRLTNCFTSQKNNSFPKKQPKTPIDSEKMIRKHTRKVSRRLFKNWRHPSSYLKKFTNN